MKGCYYALEIDQPWSLYVVQIKVNWNISPSPNAQTQSILFSPQRGISIFFFPQERLGESDFFYELVNIKTVVLKPG